jgi:chitinase
MTLYKLGLLTSLLATFHTASAKLNLNSQSNIAIYWGMLSVMVFTFRPLMR